MVAALYKNKRPSLCAVVVFTFALLPSIKSLYAAVFLVVLVEPKISKLVIFVPVVVVIVAAVVAAE